MKFHPFTINISDSELTDLQERLTKTRWPDTVSDPQWNYGTNLEYMRKFAAYWQNDFDWRKAEAQLNNLAHYTTRINGHGLHFIQEKSNASGAVPLLLLHGWPDSFMRFYKVLPLLTDESDLPSFNVVVPSIPGFGFSERPTKPGFDNTNSADMLVELMHGLGYEKFYVHGGDVGSWIAEAIVQRHPESVLGVHLTDIPYWHLFAIKPDELSEAEKSYLAHGQKWQQTSGAYAHIQSTKPQSLAYGLNDSPVGLAAWIVEHFRNWSDCDGDPENKFTKDELLTNIMLYWHTQTIGASFRNYYETANSRRLDSAKYIDVPTAVALFPKDLTAAPREFAKRFYNIQRWTEMPRGGHFAALEEPELFAQDVQTFVNECETFSRS